MEGRALLIISLTSQLIKHSNKEFIKNTKKVSKSIEGRKGTLVNVGVVLEHYLQRLDVASSRRGTCGGGLENLGILTRIDS